MCEYLDTKNEQFMKKKLRLEVRAGRGQKNGIRGNFEKNQLYQVFWDIITGRFRPYVWSGLLTPISTEIYFFYFRLYQGTFINLHLSQA